MGVPEAAEFRIPDEEFAARLERVRASMAERGLDCLFVFSNETDPSDVRYLSDYWPNFENAGVLVPAEGAAVLLIGPEAETYASSRSRIREMRRLPQLAESAMPGYPGMHQDRLADVINEVADGRGFRRVGIVETTTRYASRLP